MLLNVHSYYSLRYGTIAINDLVAGLLARGYDTAVLTDINNSSAVMAFIKECQKRDINGLAGMEFRNGDTLCYIGIAKNTVGFKQLNEWRTYHNEYNIKLPEDAPEYNDVYWIYPFGKKQITALKEQEYIGVRRFQLNKLRLNNASKSKYVIWQPVSFISLKNYELHKQLRAIDNNLLVSQLSPQQYADNAESFPSKQQLLNGFKDFPELISNTEKLLDTCSFDFVFNVDYDFSTNRNKKTFKGSRYADEQYIEELALQGLERRYGLHNEPANERVRRELDIIKKLNFTPHYLITNDICRYATHKGFHYVGRGSGANSLVAYCLGITDVCPIELNLYFERFLNPKRKSPPDFDVDFSWRDRDAIYEHIFKTYPNVALLGATSTFKNRSILRELGKIYGLPKSEIDLMVYDPDAIMNKHEVAEMILSVHGQMENFPNQRTIHASGVLISEEPLTCYSALDYPPKGMPTVQYDMYHAEDIGLEKFDILSQRGLGHIKDCIELVQQNKQKTIDVHDVKSFFKNEPINNQLKSANTVGCFYIESPAMRQLISKLNCNNYLTLVAASSIIRPGVASSGMMKAYIERHNTDPGNINYLHPVMKEHLADTYGIMVYQEDVMRIGHHFGGLDLADADVLRRMMSGKKRDTAQLQEIEDKFFNHCKEQGYSEDIALEVWRQIESFAGFSFNKAHSASYAVESYQSLYLKTNFPMEFMVSVINNHGGFYHSKVYFNEVRKVGATLHPPCVNNSNYVTNIKGNNVYVGLENIQNLEGHFAQLIPDERTQNGDYTSLNNLLIRTGIGLEQLVILIRSGAFNFTGIDKKTLLWEAHLLLSGVKQKVNALPLFDHTVRTFTLPELETNVVEDIYDEIELFGFPISASMFDLVKTAFRGDASAKTLAQFEGKTIRILGDFVADKKVWTKQKKIMKFGTFFDANGDFFDTVHFPPSLKTYPLNGFGVYLIQGKVVLDFGYPSIEVEKIARVPLLPDPRSE
jgi:DNA-directed DNA polymerase III PolC